MATAPTTPDKMTLDRTDGSATIALYRAALGPVHTDYYLRAFTRFDAAGKTSPLWNWTAALLTLNWLLFRQLWVAAMAYTGALVAAALLLVGIARLVFQASTPTQWLLAGVALLLAIGLPGAFGNTWLYAACNKKMERALVDSATLDEACALLAAKAAGRKRMGALLAGNGVLGALLAATVFFWPDSHSLPFDPGQTLRAVPVESLHSGLAAQSVGLIGAAPASAAASASATAPAPAPEASAQTAPASAPAIVPAAAASASASASASTLVPLAAPATQPNSALLASPTPVTASRVSQGVVQLAAAPAALPTLAGATAAAAKPVASAPPPAAPAPAVVASKPPAIAVTPEKKLAPAHETRAEKAARLAEKKLQARKDKAAQAKAAKAAASASASASAPATKTAASAPATKGATPTPAAKPAHAAAAPASAPAAEKFLINVGLFADANNARNAMVKLQDAGLPAVSQEVKSSKGPRTRVRVGPFETLAEADRVADKIHALKLDAVVFKP